MRNSGATRVCFSFFVIFIFTSAIFAGSNQKFSLAFADLGIQESVDFGMPSVLRTSQLPQEATRAAWIHRDPVQDDGIKAAVIAGIRSYLSTIEGTCFSSEFSIGDISKFEAAVNSKINRIIVGTEGAAWLKANSPGANSSHYAWRGIGMTADIIFRFDPRSPSLSFTQKQTMMHEVTHHIEWLNGVKQPSKYVTPITGTVTKNPASERNTNYQDRAINAIAAWAKVDRGIKEKKISLGQGLAVWKDLETELLAAEKGDADTGNKPPDDNLRALTGFYAPFEQIKQYYRANKCGDDFRMLMFLSDVAPRLDWQLDVVGPAEMELGDTITLKTEPFDSVGGKVTLPPELGAVLKWRVPRRDPVVGGELKFTPTEAIGYLITVDLVVPFMGKDITIAHGEHNVIVNPGKDPTPSPTPESTPEATPTPSPTPSPGTTPVPAGTPQAVSAAFANRSSRTINVWSEGREPKTMMDVLESHFEPGWPGAIKATIAANGIVTFYAGEAGAATGGTNKVLTSCIWQREPGVSGQIPSITYEANGTLTCGTKGVVSRVKLVPATLNVLKIGDIASVEAVVEGLKPEERPLTYSWGGTFEGNAAELKSTSKVTVRGNKIGKYKLSVSVAGKNGDLGKASLEYEVGDVSVEIKQVSPATKKVPVGMPVTFSAKVPVAAGATAPKYIYRWQPHPEVTFDPYEGEKTTTTATFLRPGLTKVWVQVLQQKGSILSTVAESKQIEVEVVEPELTIKFEPEAVLIGNEVKARVEVEPAELKEIDFRWEISANGRQTMESPDKREVTLVPQNAEPITVTVRGRVPFKGDDLGEATATVTASKYDVRVTVLGAEGPKPQVWKEGVGLVPLEKGIAVHQFVGLRADVTPMPAGVRYEWRVNEDTHFASNSITQQIRVSRSQVGTGEATVIVRDKNGLELGQATGTFSVTVSQADLDGARKKGDVSAKLIQAKEIIRKGMLDEAITLADEVIAVTPKNAEAVTLSKKWNKERVAVQASVAKARGLLDQNKFVDASAALNAAKGMHPLYKPVTDLDKEINDKWGKHDAAVKEAIGAVRMANEAKDFKKALSLVPEVRSKYKLTAASEAELKRYEDWAREHETEKERRRGILKQAEAKLNAGDYDGVLRDVDEMWKNFDAYWSFTVDPEPKIAENLKNEALKRRDRIATLMMQVKAAAEAPKFDKKQLQLGLTNADEVIRIVPGNADAQRYKAIIADRLARGEKGAKADDSLAKGDAQQASGDHKGAIKSYDSAIKADPNNAETYIKRGKSKLAINDVKGALKDFDRAIELKSGVASWYMIRAGARDKAGDTNGAISDYQNVVIIEPRNMDALTALAAIYIRTNNYAGLIDVYTKIINLEPKNARAYLARGMAYQSNGSCQLAIFDYEKAYSLDPRSSPAYNGHGECREQGNDLKNALKDYEKAVQLDPSNAQAVANRDRLKLKTAPTPRPTPIKAPKPTPKPIPTPKATPVTAKPKPTPAPSATPKKPIKIPGLGTIKVGPSSTPTPLPKATPGRTSSGKESQVLNNGNIGGVSNNPTSPTTFRVTGPWVLTYIQTYHWNNGSGTSRPGSIGVYNDSGQRFGGWVATGSPGQGGVRNAYWEVRPNVVLPSGTYTIVVSSPETWAHNSTSGGRGFAVVKGYPGGTGTSTSPPVTSPVRPPRTDSGTGAALIAIIENRSNMPTHIFAAGDTFGPGNKLAPGEKREVRVYMGADGRIKFTAGRNGVAIVTKIWSGVAGDLNRYPRVIFDGSQLLITTGLR
ncbi:MAG: tetratricopeptide repeat protein [Pyrinomonadaceae bacterium]|nr:tetratricopeptide repeat protein [Pyrinomonadaceae bacterium]MBP6212558.1 tetratricopeptide repeat protein [Pyrinomonadaceae bacterium]